MTSAASNEQRAIRSFGRVRSRTLRSGPQDRLRLSLPAIALALEDPSGFDLAALKGSFASVAVEIGFGSGEHLVGQAALRPDVLFLAAEPFQNGVAALLGAAEAARLENLRLHMGDGRELLNALPDGAVDQIYVLFPDPWPKARHWKRRLVNPSFFALAARILQPQGRLRIATDWGAYAEEILWAGLREPRLAWTARRPEDWKRPVDHIETRYQRKALGDVTPLFLDFARR